MLYRIFIGLLALLCVYIAYDGGKMMWAKHSAGHAKDNYVLTSTNADLTVVEFLDYNCVHCRNLHPVLLRALEKDGKIRYIPRPVDFQPDAAGLSAARLVYAAGRQGKFIEAHNELMTNYRTIDSSAISNFSLALGLDSVQLEKDLDDPKIQRALDKNFKTIQKLKGTSVPTLLIGGKMLLQVGDTLPSGDALEALFNQARAL